jgi:hypothetical protein
MILKRRRDLRGIRAVVQLDYEGHRFTFTGDEEAPFKFWRVESDGRVYKCPMEVRGGEMPAFFRALADAALKHGFAGAIGH